MKKNLSIAILSCAVSLSSETLAQSDVLDGSSREAFDEQIEEIASDFSEEERDAFGRGLMSIAVREYPAAAGAEGLGLVALMPQAIESMHLALDGYSVEKILEEGRRLIQEEQSSAEVSRGDGTANSEEQNRLARLACLRNNVFITESRIKEQEYAAGKIVEFDVSNSLEWALAGVWIEFEIVTPGRSVPWIEQNFVQSVSGGIEPGETRTLAKVEFLPSEAGDDLRVTARILDVADANKRLFIGERKVFDWPDEASDMECK